MIHEVRVLNTLSVYKERKYFQELPLSFGTDINLLTKGSFSII